MVSNNYMNDKQHGFVPGRECMTNLLQSMDDWTKAIDLGHSIDVIYTDFSKAFDRLQVNRDRRVFFWGFFLFMDFSS